MANDDRITSSSIIVRSRTRIHRMGALRLCFQTTIRVRLIFHFKTEIISEDDGKRDCVSVAEMSLPPNVTTNRSIPNKMKTATVQR